MREYDLIAEWYAAGRDIRTGVPEVTAFTAALPAGASVLDIGCGTGIPITRALLSAGCQVVALDSSREMLARFHRNCPGITTIDASIQSCELADQAFDGAVAWGVMFHLNHEDQARAMTTVSRALKPGALFLFTSGDVDGSIDGAPMDGVPFRYFSWSVEGYRQLLRDNHMTLIETHKDRGENIYYLARRD